MTSSAVDRFEPVAVDLRNPALAALLAWLWPGAGHLYQRRYGKGILFMVCILATYFFGLAMGGGHVVYASFQKPDVRYPYLFQLGVGLPALPAVAQNYLAARGTNLFGSDLMAPPARPVYEQQHDQLASWHEQLKYFFELGTLYTMIAGLLNVLAIYDAYAGPVFSTPEGHPGARPPSDAVAGTTGDGRTRSSGGGGFQMAGLAVGVAVALYVQASLSIQSRFVTLMLAAVGGLLGGLLGRLTGMAYKRLTRIETP